MVGRCPTAGAVRAAESGMLPRHISPFLALAALLGSAACGTSSMEVATPSTDSALDTFDPAESELRRSSVHDRLFAEVGAEFGVPHALLKAIAYAQTRYHMVEGDVEFEGQPARFGMMGMTEAQLELAAARTGASLDAMKTDVREHVRAAAALLRAYADESNSDKVQVAEWAPVVARFSAIEDEEASALFARDAVFGALRAGVGEPSAALAAAGQSLELGSGYASLAQGLSSAPDFPGGVWRPSPNYNSRPAGVGPAMVVIHTCESGYSGCWSWLTNRASGVSAHYVVNESGTEVSQLVRNSSRGYHIGASYNCSLNGGTDCFRNGRSSNDFTIGIEHGGYARQTSWSAGMLDASARLSCHLSKLHGIPRDRRHFVGHGQLQPYNRTDPGANWPWSDYMARVNAHCGSGPAPADGPALTHPASASMSTGTVNVFLRGTDDAIWYKWWTGSSWSSWTNIGGTFVSSPAAVSTSSGTLYVFGRGTDNAIWYKLWNGSSWSQWVSLGGTFTSAPAAASLRPGTLNVFGRGTDNAIWYKHWNGTVWSPWVNLGGTLSSGPAAVSMSPETMNVFARGTDNAIWYKHWNGKAWGPWASIGGNLSSGPAVASMSQGTMHVFARATDNAIWQKRWDGTAWSGWESIGGNLNSGPSVVSPSPGTLTVHARATDNAVWQKSWNGASWSQWQSLGGTMK